MVDIIARIEQEYKIDIQKFLELYELGYGREEMAELLGTSVFRVRQISSLLGLRLKKKHRLTDLEILKAKLDAETGNKDVITDLVKDLEIVNQELLKLNKSLIKCRDQNNLFRRQIRELARTENLYERILQDISKELEDVEINVTHYSIEPNFYDKNGMNIICFSDLHIGAKVEKKDTGELNEFNFDIAKERINKVIEENLHSPYQSDTLLITFLGDIFDGIIYQSHLVAEMPVTQAIVKFSSFIAETLISLSKAYKNVKVVIINGNHERLSDQPAIFHKSFDFTHLFYELTKSLVQPYENINVDYSFSGFYLETLPNNKKAFMFHGDINRSYKAFNEKEQLKTMMLCKQMFNVEPDLLLSGHIHTYHKAILPNYGYAITVGSLLGTNAYSFNSGWLEAIPSQIILFYNSKGELQKEKVVILKDLGEKD